MDPLAAGDPVQVGGYRLRFRLGAGGMGRVFLGFSPAGRAVAVKVVHPELARDPEFMQRFRREVRAAESVSGAYTAPVVAAGPDDDPPWLATAFVAGPTLADLIEQAGPLPEAAAWRLAGGLIEALQAVHARGLVHRDLKPTNVLLAADGPRVIDFGISRALVGATMTASRVIMGTPGFMSPGQVQGLTVGFASDVFALGCVIGFAVTGAAPFGSGDIVTMSYRIVHTQPDLSGIPVSLRNLVASCLAKAPADRPPLPRLLEAAISESAVQLATSSATFWPEPIAGLISSRRESQAPARAGSGVAAAMPPLLYQPTAPASAGPSEDGMEATGAAAGISALRGGSLANQPHTAARESILAESANAEAAGASAIGRVPRTEAEQEQLLLERPIGWEYLYYAARLLHERNSIEGKYRDFLLGHAPPTGRVVSYQDAPSYLLKASQDSRQLVKDASDFMNSDVPEHVFGPPGVAGDPEAIEHYAHQINGLYEDILDWVAELRGVGVPAEFSRAFELLAHLNDNAVFEYRRFVDDVVAHNDKLPAQIAAGRVESRTFTLRLTVPDEVINAYSAELRRLQGIDTTSGWQEGGQDLQESVSKPRYLAIMQIGDRTFQLGRYPTRGLAMDACERRPEWHDTQWRNMDDGQAITIFQRKDGTEVTFAVLDAFSRSPSGGHRLPGEFSGPNEFQGGRAASEAAVQEISGERRSAAEMAIIFEDLIKLMDSLSSTYRRGKYPDSREAERIAAVLRGVANDVDI